MLSTYDLEMILDGKTPVTGCDLHAIRFCTRYNDLISTQKLKLVNYDFISIYIFICDVAERRRHWSG